MVVPLLIARLLTNFIGPLIALVLLGLGVSLLAPELGLMAMIESMLRSLIGI